LTAEASIIQLYLKLTKILTLNIIILYFVCELLNNMMQIKSYSHYCINDTLAFKKTVSQGTRPIGELSL